MKREILRLGLAAAMTALTLAAPAAVKSKADVFGEIARLRLTVK